MRYFISDCHYWHQGIISKPYMPRYKSFTSLENMHTIMINNWNKVVKTKDTVYIVGDFSFGNYEDTKGILDQLKGNKILIRGNHDNRLSTKDYLDMGFSEVRDEMYINLANQDILLKHYPYAPGLFKRLYYKYIQRYKWRTLYNFQLMNRGLWLISGHHHGAPFLKDKTFNVSCETLNYKPVSETYIIEKINEYRKNSLQFKFFYYIKKIRHIISNIIKLNFYLKINKEN